MVYYNMTNVSLANNTADVFIELNKIGGFWPANAVVILVFVISFLVTKTAFEESPARSVTGSLFLTMVVSVLLFFMGALQVYVLVMVIVLFGISLATYRMVN